VSVTALLPSALDGDPGEERTLAEGDAGVADAPSRDETGEPEADCALSEAPRRESRSGGEPHARVHRLADQPLRVVQLLGEVRVRRPRAPEELDGASDGHKAAAARKRSG
jgi:hypothetical protein